MWLTVGRCEVIARRQRAGETATKRRRTSPGPRSLDSLLQESGCEDTSKRTGKPLALDTVFNLAFLC